MGVAEKIRLTEAQEAILAQGGVVAIPATWEEFWEFLQETEYRAEYHNEKIIVMGLAAFVHEVLVGQLITLLSNFYKGTEFLVAGSNVGVKTDGHKQGYYNPDVTVVKGLPQFWEKSIAVITNPYLVVEVLSESTYHYDLQHKLAKYEKLESVFEVAFIDRFHREVQTFRRTDNPKVWTQTFFTQPVDVVSFGVCWVGLGEIFEGLPEGLE
ncbi:MAG: Uma2 family endonuclease [Sphingobacteriaceae bacterium]|nr:Uma2 family endonuclease [Cytophagaceae bacterium]